MAWTRVKNRGGIGVPRCRTCPSWLRHWENGTNQRALTCGAYGCRNTEVIVALVMKVGGSDRATYIVPICARCNAWTGEFEVLWALHPTSSGRSCQLQP